MPPFVMTTRHDDVVVVEIDNPPVNALSPGVPEALGAAIAAAEHETRRRRRSWSRARDARSSPAPTSRRSSRRRGADERRGARLARSAAADRGLPQAGRDGDPRHRARRRPRAGDGRPLPRRGGTARRSASPRSISASFPAPKARSGCRGSWASRRRSTCASPAEPIKAAEALAAGLIDAVIGRRSHRAARRVRARVGGAARRIRRRASARDRLGTPATNAPLFAAARELAAKVKRHQTAPLKAIDAIEAAATLPFDEGLPPRARALPRVRARASRPRR